MRHKPIETNVTRQRAILTALASMAVTSLLSGCVTRRWECVACLATDAKVCGNSNNGAVGASRTAEWQARCLAGEEMCGGLVADPRFDSVCRRHRSSAMTGCSDAFLGQLTFTCSSSNHLSLPWPGVR